jgi:putative endonuclease
MHFVYVLQSEKTGKFYIGETANLEDRLARHHEGRVPSTKAGRPWKMIHVERFERRLDALSRERELKGWRSHERIVVLINKNRLG